ncbi:MAG: hypothetical protein IKP88_18190 [Lachnospiraceae bacterium]|nr:hypothetical protein [Lachnospiraceae bacterium]
MKRCIFTALLIIIVFSIIACGSNDDSDDGTENSDSSETESRQDKTENTQNGNGGKSADNSGSGSNKNHEPDNYNNNGYTNIMETELGYYFNLGYWPSYTVNSYRHGSGTRRNWMNLKYLDKESGIIIYLCNRPECEHLGDEGCVATYKNLRVINTVLYENYIYVYGVEQIDKEYKFNLYRVPLDGSSIDIVGTVYEDRQINDNKLYDKPNYVLDDDYYFIIHKGFAYLPYYFRDGEGMMGFKSGGLKRMNIDTGNVEDVYNLQLANDSFPCRLYAIGDEIYLYLRGNNRPEGWMSYNTTTKSVDYTEWDKAYAEKYDITLKKNQYHYNPLAENEKYGFDLGYLIKDEGKQKSLENGDLTINELSDDDVGYKIFVYGKYSLDAIEDKCIVTDVKKSEIELNSWFSKNIMVNDEQLFLICNNRILMYSLKEDEWGKNIGVFNFDDEFVTERDERKNNAIYNYYEGYRMTGGKLYYTQKWDASIDSYVYYYSCPVDSILNGEGRWELVYLIEEGSD